MLSKSEVQKYITNFLAAQNNSDIGEYECTTREIAKSVMKDFIDFLFKGEALNHAEAIFAQYSDDTLIIMKHISDSSDEKITNVFDGILSSHDLLNLVDKEIKSRGL